ncbi:MAG: hypothetical protein QNJ98_14095 [Planctomycetota bacterium]|nr:hypothetical protein [Planctomycetota bacterium]
MTTAQAPLLELDHTFMPGPELDGAKVAAWVERLRTRHAAGELGFLDLPRQAELLAQAEAWAAEAPEADELVVVGIGGSALSARVFEAIRPERFGAPRLTVVDTVDPSAVEALLEDIDPARTILLGVSKSGTTLETASVFPVFEHALEDALGAQAAKHIALIAGVEPNPLRAHANEKGYACLDVPVNVGGRFSGLTPVGLLPAALMGVSPAGLLAGAEAVRALAFEPDPNVNPALALAMLSFRAQHAGLHTSVVWPYGERLSPLGPWCAQLISESIGQRRLDDGEPVGVAAFPARGPADQHSLLQLLLDGPQGRLCTFVSAPSHGDGPRVDVGGGESTLGDVLEAEREATAYALTTRDRPHLSIRLRDAGPESIGAFLMLYEAAIALWGLGLDIDPFVQPAVGLGKQAAMAQLTGGTGEMADALRAHAETPRRIVAVP